MVLALLAYCAEGNHPGPKNAHIEPGHEVGAVSEKIECRDRIGEMLRHSQRRVADIHMA